MSAAEPGFSKMGFAKTFVLPCLLIFVVPAAGLAFFLHAESRFDAQARESILRQISEDRKLSAEERAEAIEQASTLRFSRLIQDPNIAQGADDTVRFNYATFRWMIRLSLLSILASVLVFALAGVCVVCSLSSQRMQYWSLSVGWQVLRIYAAFQTLVQGIVAVALSFWVTALWLQMYSVKLIAIVGIFALVGIAAVVAAIFKRVDMTFDVAGTLLDPTRAGRFCEELNSIARKVNTPPPDQVIVGIDDNFFVTEVPVRVDGKKISGRTLFASLSLLKQLDAAEADGVLAHELAHFSGSDTFYSKKIAPLLERYQRYLVALHHGGVGQLVFPVMYCFRMLFELSLRQRQRQREFRADRIAAETTSSRDMAGALLRIGAYSKFRIDIQRNLFKEERVLETANIAEQIAAGFPSFALRFAAEHDIGELRAAHPFDSHPSLADRLEAVGVPLSPQTAESLLGRAGDGGWYRMIDNAEEIERQQWNDFESKFRKAHEASLAYRFLPETEEECAVVVKAFPEVLAECSAGRLTMNYVGLHFSGWQTPIKFEEIKQCQVENGVLSIHYQRGGMKKETLKVNAFGKQQQAVIDTIGRYWGRHQTAVAYQSEKQAEQAAAVSATIAGS
jgi:Zn-dependent protease with chaperone function